MSSDLTLVTQAREGGCCRPGAVLGAPTPAGPPGWRRGALLHVSPAGADAPGTIAFGVHCLCLEVILF